MISIYLLLDCFGSILYMGVNACIGTKIVYDSCFYYC